MTSTNKYTDTKAIDYLEAIKRNQLEAKNAKSSTANFLMKYMLPVPTSVAVATSFTNTEKTIGDYEVFLNSLKNLSILPPYTAS